IWDRIGRATGAQAISLRVMECAPGLSPAIRNHECDQILYVLEREPSLKREAHLERGHPAPMSERSERQTAVRFAAIVIDGRSFEIGPDTGIYIRPHEIFQM